MSHPTRGEWIEIQRFIMQEKTVNCLTPHGVSGLKSISQSTTSKTFTSHPTRGEWIEILVKQLSAHSTYCLTPHGVSGLKYSHAQNMNWEMVSLTPHGVSGLKYRVVYT